MMQRVIDWIWKLRWLTWLVVGTAAVAAAWLVPPLQFDQSIEGFFPDDHPGLADYHRARSLFDSDDLAFVAYKDPQLWSKEGIDRVQSLAAGMEAIDGVVRVESLDAMPIPWRIDDIVETVAADNFSIFQLLGKISQVMAARSTMAEALRSAADDPERMARLRERICNHGLFRGLLIDPDGETTALIVTFKSAREVDHKRVIAKIRERADAFGARNGFEHVSVAGPPVLVSDGFVSLDRDNQTLGVIAMALMALTMLVAVRNPGWALLPLVAGWSTWQLVRTMLWLFDLRLTLSSGPIVAQTVVLCMPAAAHLAMRFRELRAEIGDPIAAARGTLVDIAVPIAWCSVTAAAGYFAAWLTSDVLPVSQFGLTMAVSNLAAGLLSYVLAAGAMGVSAVSWKMPGFWRTSARGASEASGEAGHLWARDPSTGRVSRLTPWIVRHPWIVVGGFVIPAAILSVGSARLELESNYINVFRARSRVVSDYYRIEAELGGIGIIEVVLPAPEEPTVEWLQELEAAAQVVQDSDPEIVSDVLSPADVLFPENASELPPHVLRRVIQLKTTMLRAKFPYVLDRMWNQRAGAARIMIRIRESAPAEQKRAFLARLDAWAKARSAQPTYLTGLSNLLSQIVESIVTTSFYSAGWSACLVFAMLAVALRSLRLAVLALFPTALAVGLVLGVMGWFNLKIDMTTALVASVAIGLSVDDTFHCLLHWEQKLRAGLPAKEALIAAYAASGPGVILGSSAVSLGFLSSMVSEFVPTANFGWLVAVATLGGSAGNLLVLPAVLALTSRDAKPVA